MKRWILSALLMVGLIVPSLGQTTSFYTDRAVATFPVPGRAGSVVALIPIANGQVRACQLPLTQQQPCLPLANITDINNNPISNNIGGAFGQLTTDVVGRFTFGCQVNLNYQIQVAPASLNVPQLNYPITCPGTGANPSFTTLTTNSIISEKPWVNVQFFAGVDPTGVGDSTTGVQNAINFAMGSGNCNPLYFPVGTYKITSAPTYTWTNCNELVVHGDGRVLSKINYTAAMGNLFSCVGTAAQRKTLSIHDITLNATAATTAVAASYTACQYSIVDNMQITGFSGGIRITGTGNVGDGTSGNSFYPIINHVLINNYVPGGYAINVDHTVELHLRDVELFAIGDSDITSQAVIFDTGTNGTLIGKIDAVSGLHTFVFRNTNQGGAFGGVPSGFYIETALGDSSAGGDAWLFDSTLSTNNVTLTCFDCWARHAGINNNGSTATAGAIGFNISGGSDIHFVGGWAIENALNGISVTSSGSNISFDTMNIQRNNFNNNTANTPGAIVGANPTRVRFSGGMYNNLGGGNQNYGIDYSANSSTIVSGIDADNNVTGTVNPPATNTKVFIVSALASPDTFPSTDTSAWMRLASNRYFSWKSSISGNIIGFSKDTSDRFAVGGSPGIVLSGPINSPNATATMGMTLKKGSGAGNYTNATTSYTVADSANLCFTVTIPTGWKLGVATSGALSTATAAVGAQAALTDNAACATANAGILVETAPIQGAGIGIPDAFSLNWVITGDGNAHNIALQFKTSNAADSANLINSSATITPTMVFTLMPSN